MCQFGSNWTSGTLNSRCNDEATRVSEIRRLGDVPVTYSVDCRRHLGNGPGRIDQLVEDLASLEPAGKQFDGADLDDAVGFGVQPRRLRVEYHGGQGTQRQR